MKEVVKMGVNVSSQGVLIKLFKSLMRRNVVEKTYRHKHLIAKEEEVRT